MHAHFGPDARNDVTLTRKQVELVTRLLEELFYYELTLYLRFVRLLLSLRDELSGQPDVLAYLDEYADDVLPLFARHLHEMGCFLVESFVAVLSTPKKEE